jgi:outer membrane protein assembly factor BamB
MPVDPGIPVRGWPARLTSPAATPLMVAGGRVAVVDGDGVLHCWEQASGTRVWGVSLGSAVGGPPTIHRRRVFVGTTDGRVMAFDAADGSSVGVLKSPLGVTTRILIDGNTVVYGCADGSVRAVDFTDGRVLWTQAIGRVPQNREIALADSGVLVMSEGRLLRLDRQTGALLAELPIADPVHGVAVQQNRAFVQMRRPRTRRDRARDLLLAVQADTLEVLWEYVLPEEGPGLFGRDDLVVALPSSTGDIILFR